MRFGERAGEYVDHAFLQRDLVEWGSRWLPDSLATAQVLELGAGPGVLTRELLARGAEVLATDLAAGMVRAGEANFPQASWAVMDAWKPQGEYDLVCSSALMQWAPDPAAVLTRMAGVLRPGGRMLHLFFTDPTLTEFRRLAPAWNPFCWRTHEQWSRAFDVAGLEVLREEAQTHRVIFSNARELLRFFQRTGAVGRRRVPTGELRRFLGEYERHFREDNGVVSTWTFYRVEAFKPA
ncbi:MAG: methyltransferase domain-containing protein [Verrucomicrobiota bacterium JB024]|nr:methyltransferase domain-containing protein [Verrucomicrobiota bacterium JB024]